MISPELTSQWLASPRTRLSSFPRSEGGYSVAQKKERPVRTLAVLLVVIGVIFGSVVIGTLTSSGEEGAGASFVPKFALDLAGGTEMVLTPKMADNSAVSSDDIGRAIDIIRNRIDSSGVAEAEISAQGTQNIVVGIPGNPSAEDLALVTRSAHMTFRTVLKEDSASMAQVSDWMTRTYDNPNFTPPPEEGDTADQDTAEASPEPEATAEPEASPTPEANPDQAPAANTLPVPPDPAYALRLTDGLNQDGLLTSEVQQQFQDISCAMAGSQATGEVSNPDEVLVTCSQEGASRFVLGPVMIDGSVLATAQSGQRTGSQGTTTGIWVVNIEFNGDGAAQFGAVTEELNRRCQADETSPLRQFAIVLDDLVISAPQVCNGAIYGGKAEISGNFTQASSKSLADQLAFGALPINFQVESQQQVSATLGSSQLEKGLWAGLIGLILVALYSFFQYRALAFVTVLSLVIATSVTYGTILLLSWLQGYRLSLAGVAGIIVSIGITADSFIVYFERIKDELRVGRALSQAVEVGWVRARRTILASDAVQLIAAIVLYFVAVGGVRGFAFTLGLTTVMDVVVVMFFTHPVILLLTRTKFWGGGHPWSGLDPVRLGAPGAVRYAGRGRFDRSPGGEEIEVPVSSPAVKPTGSIAERKRAQAAATDEGGEV